MLAEGEPKPHRRRNESICGAPVAHFGVWVGPFSCQSVEVQQDTPLIRRIARLKYVAAMVPQREFFLGNSDLGI